MNKATPTPTPKATPLTEPLNLVEPEWADGDGAGEFSPDGPMLGFGDGALPSGDFASAGDGGETGGEGNGDEGITCV